MYIINLGSRIKICRNKLIICWKVKFVDINLDVWDNVCITAYYQHTRTANIVDLYNLQQHSESILKCYIRKSRNLVFFHSKNLVTFFFYNGQAYHNEKTE